MMKHLVILVAAFLSISGISAPAQATQGVTKTYSSCADLLEKYPNGVAKNKKARNKAVKGGLAKPGVSKGLYKKNASRLDRDKDGVMCEQVGLGSGDGFSLDGEPIVVVSDNVDCVISPRVIVEGDTTVAEVLRDIGMNAPQVGPGALLPLLG